LEELGSPKVQNFRLAYHSKPDVDTKIFKNKSHAKHCSRKNKLEARSWVLVCAKHVGIVLPGE
jgi:hypothetical protein